MSSSEGEDDISGDKGLDRALFTKLIVVYPIIIEQSKIPSAISAKKKAWDTIQQEYSAATGKVVTVAQLQKLLSNMKSIIKVKTDKNKTGNKKIKLKEWEKQLYDVLSQKENPVFFKIPGSVLSVGLGPVKDSEEDIEGSDVIINSVPGTSTSDQVEKASPAATKIRKSVKKVMSYETDDTRDLSTPQIQRIVLLQQKKLQEIQIAIAQRKLEKLTKNVSDDSTQTDIFDCVTTFYN